MTEHTLNPNGDDDMAGVEPELHDDYRKLNNLVRGNVRLESQLMQRGKAVNPAQVMQVQVSLLAQVVLGPAEQSQARLDYEIAVAEIVRSALNQALLQP